MGLPEWISRNGSPGIGLFRPFNEDLRLISEFFRPSVEIAQFSEPFRTGSMKKLWLPTRRLNGMSFKILDPFRSLQRSELRDRKAIRKRDGSVRHQRAFVE